MKLARQLYRLSMLNPRNEFFTILAWALLCPWKDSPSYYLILALLVFFFAFRNIYFMKNLTLSSFSYFLVAFNLVLFFSAFFSVYLYQSLLWVADIFLVSLYFILFFPDGSREDRYFHLLAYLISIMSFLNVLNAIFSIFPRKNFFFTNPIFQGVASGIAVLILLYYLLRIPFKGSKRLQKIRGGDEPNGGSSWGVGAAHLGLLVVNGAGVFVSQSKGAFIGVAVLSLLMVLLKKKKLVPVVVVLIILTFILPNPIKKMFIHSLTTDPYAANRIDIWKMSVTIFKDFFPLGVGPGNFKEVTRQYNFKQTRGPAHYVKRPRHPHSDYFKLLTETGLPGLIFLLVLGWFLVKKIFSSSLFNLSKLLLLYLLFQALVFNLIFHVFFFFVFIFLLKNLFERHLPLTHRSFFSSLKTYYVFVLIFTLVAGYLLPYLSQRLVAGAQGMKETRDQLDLLEKAQYFNPLDADIFYLKALVFHRDFIKTADPESFYPGLASVKKAQRLNRYLINAYGLESEFYGRLPRGNLNYKGLAEEMIAPLTAAEQYDPLNPFIKMRKAELYLRFNRGEEANQAALQALELEPDYAAALYFLQNHFNLYPDKRDFEDRIGKISKKASQHVLEKDSYLDKIFKIPGGGNEEI
ncbi:MAG: hypothetical protein GY950_21510 [bacterium]|nr:hypothetical protein [bacterium]